MLRKTGFVRFLAASFVGAALLLPGPVEGAPERASVRLVAFQGEPVRGELGALGPDGVTVSAAAGERTVGWDALRLLEIRSSFLPRLIGRAHLRVALVSGEVLLGTYAGSIEDGLVLDTPDLGRIPLLLDVVRSLVPVPADADPCYEPEHRHPATGDDIAYVTSGDAFTGIVLEIGDEGLVVETSRGQQRRIAWDDLKVLHLANETPPRPEGVTIEVETREGSRLVTAGPPLLDDGGVQFALRSVPQRPLTLSVFAIRSIRAQGGAFIYASDLPYDETFTPYYGDASPEAPVLAEWLAFLGRWYGARADRRPSGCPIRLDGETYRHGFAVHARSHVRIPLGRGYRTFDALVGVDDEALGIEPGGIVDVRVLGDDKVLWEAKDVRAGTAPRHVGPLDVSEVETLVLLVDFGADMHTADRAAWADPILVRR